MRGPMACNAWNHPPDCKCGWGRIFYGLNSKTEKHYWQVSDSYTNPNAACPICNSRVFFYQSPYGGKVYFDHMGPPWPRHPCTSQNARTALTKQIFTTNPKLTEFQIDEGWRPVFCSEIKRSTELDDDVVLSLYEPDNRKFLYAKTLIQKLDVRSPILIRRVKDQRYYEISTLTLRDDIPVELRFLAFPSIEEFDKFTTEASLKEYPLTDGEDQAPRTKRNYLELEAKKKKNKYEPNRQVKVTVLAKRVEVIDQLTGKKKFRIEKGLETEQSPNDKKSTRRLEILQKRAERQAKRQVRECEEKNKSIPQIKTALELAYEEAQLNFSNRE